ncbi:hypothetical protein C0J52_09702 [Blattella germanica]|nr:hypothetical protein C0J52_09702 [Blattella germanica]
MYYRPVDCLPSGWQMRWMKIINDTEVAFGHAIYFSANILTGLGLRGIQPTTVNDIIYVMIGSIISTVIFFSIMSANIANSILSRRHWYVYQGMTHRLRSFITYRKLDKELNNRLEKFINHEWQHNEGVNFLHRGILVSLPKYLNDEVRIDISVNFLKKVSLFKELSDEFINKLATLSTIHLVPEEELVVFAGSATYELHIILDGYCEIISSLHHSLNKVIGPGSYFGEMEMCLEMPITDTVRTITTCKIIKVNFLNYRKVASFYPSLKSEFLQLSSEIQAIREKARRKIAVQYIELSKVNVQTKKQSFYNFGYKLLPNTPKGQDYFRPFDKLKIFTFVQFLLLRVTIFPDGLFIKYWEISRMIFAFVSCMIYPAITVCEVSRVYWLVHVAHVMDITAYIDLNDLSSCFVMLRLLQVHRIIHGIFYRAHDSHRILPIFK